MRSCRRLALRPGGDFVEMLQEVVRILVNPQRTRSFKLADVVAAGEQADTRRLAAPGCEHVPYGIPDDHTGLLTP